MFSGSDPIFQFKFLKIRETIVKKGKIIELKSDHDFLFGEVEKIVEQKGEIFILYKYLINPSFDFHFDCMTFEGTLLDISLAKKEEIVEVFDIFECNNVLFFQ